MKRDCEGDQMKRLRFRNWKMQNKLFLGFLLLISLILLLLVYFSMTVSENSIKTQMLTSIQETTRQMSDNIDNEILANRMALLGDHGQTGKNTE